MNTEVIPEYTHRWVKDGQKFYTARISSDMLGWWAVTCEWGSLHSSLGQVRTWAFSTLEGAEMHLYRIFRRRKARGYVPRC